MEPKRNILEKSIILFCSNGYENVTIRDIAIAANTVTAEVYNYFISKEDILEEIYKLFSEVIMAEAMKPEDYIPILESGTREDILNVFNFPLPEPVELNFCVIRIVFTRKSSDERAKSVYMRFSWEKAVEYIRKVFMKGVEMGRLVMSVDEIDTLAYLIHASREYSANMITIIPDQKAWRKTETDMIKQLSTLIALNDTEPIVTPTIDAHEALLRIINHDSLSVGKYRHCSSMLKKNGYSSLASFVDEIIENILDELDMLYLHINGDKKDFNYKDIMAQIAINEKAKWLDAENNNPFIEEDASTIFSEIIDLAQQHERLCINSLNSRGFVGKKDSGETLIYDQTWNARKEMGNL